MRDRDDKQGMAIDIHGVIHVNIIHGKGRYGAWALCENDKDMSAILVSAIDRPAPTCLWCARTLQCSG